MNTDLSKKLGLRIRELRLARNIKQGELADMLLMERSNLTRIENGKQRPNDDNIIKIAELLKVQIKDLFDFEHFDDVKVIKSCINDFVNSANKRELMFLYKTIQNISEM